MLDVFWVRRVLSLVFYLYSFISFMKVLSEIAVPFSDQILRVTGLSTSEFGIT